MVCAFTKLTLIAKTPRSEVNQNQALRGRNEDINMSLFKINHKEASEGGKTVKPGSYQATVSKAVAKKSTTGNPMITLDFTVRKDIEQPHGGDSVRFDNLVLTEASMWKVQTYAKAMGLPDGMEVDTPEELASIMLGCNVEIEVGEREYQGKTYAEVKRVSPAIDAVDDEATVDVGEDDLPF